MGNKLSISYDPGEGCSTLTITGLNENPIELKNKGTSVTITVGSVEKQYSPKQFKMLPAIEKVSGLKLSEDERQELDLAIKTTVALHKTPIKKASLTPTSPTLTLWIEWEPLGVYHGIKGDFYRVEDETVLSDVQVILREDLVGYPLPPDLFDELLKDMEFLGSSKSLTWKNTLNYLENQGYVIV